MDGYGEAVGVEGGQKGGDLIQEDSELWCFFQKFPLEVWRPVEGQLSTEPVVLCFDSKDGGIEGSRGQSYKCEGFQCWLKDSPMKIALAASEVLPSPQHEPDIQALKYMLNE